MPAGVVLRICGGVQRLAVVIGVPLLPRELAATPATVEGHRQRFDDPYAGKLGQLSMDLVDGCCSAPLASLHPQPFWADSSVPALARTPTCLLCKNIYLYVNLSARARPFATIAPVPGKRRSATDAEVRLKQLLRAWSQGGKRGGPKGGKARWRGVSAEERRAHARKAALARWAKTRKT